MKRHREIVLFPCIAFLILLSCRKESFTYSKDALLQVSIDTLHFNSLFTSSGSVSQSVKIINTNNKSIHISSVKLAGGYASPFKINIDGSAGPENDNIDIAPNDSIYVFVTASIHPDSKNQPFIIRDSIQVLYNSNVQWIQLDATGQNAHIITNRTITKNELWTNDLPYVILNSLTVLDTARLTIGKGCHIYIHSGASFIIKGSLVVNGEKDDSSRVIFSGDRLDDPYKDYPAGYPGLIFTGTSKNNRLEYTIIKNAYQGINISGLPISGDKLTLKECIIGNCYDAGVMAFNTSINATNVLISNCSKNILIVNGGDYNFTHCTAAGYSNDFIQHKYPVLSVSNFDRLSGASNPLNATFTNCIFWADNNGFVSSEVFSEKDGTVTFNLTFDHILWRVQENPQGAVIKNAIQDPPLFDSINTYQKYYSFRLKDNSPAIKAGIGSGVITDLDGNPRPVTAPDLGCYQKQ